MAYPHRPELAVGAAILILLVATPTEQLLSLIVGSIAKAASTPAHPLHFDAGFSINGLT